MKIPEGNRKFESRVQRQTRVSRLGWNETRPPGHEDRKRRPPGRGQQPGHRNPATERGKMDMLKEALEI